MMAIAQEMTRGAWDELGFHFAPQVVLATALKLGVFPAIAEGAEGVDSIASATACSTRGMRMLLNCMAAMGLLEKDHERYSLSSLSRQYFLPSGEDYIGNLFASTDQLMRLWLTLPEAVRTGRPTISIFQEKERERLNINIVDGLFQAHRVYAWKLVDVLQSDGSFLVGHNETVEILDVAAGSAVWSLPFALRHQRVEVTAIDFDPVLEVAKRYTRRFAVEGQYRFIGGDIRRLDFGSGRYHLILLGHICHSEGVDWSQQHIGKCFRALREKGKLLIMDYIPDERRKSAAMPLLLGLNALLGSEEGDTFAFSQYKQWLLKAGFSEVRTIRVDDHCPIIVGLKD